MRNISLEIGDGGGFYLMAIVTWSILDMVIKKMLICNIGEILQEPHKHVDVNMFMST